MSTKTIIKNILGELPLTAELYWQFRQGGGPLSESFSLERLEEMLPGWIEAASKAAAEARPGKRALVFTTLRYWIEHGALLSCALAGLGHQVTLAYLPYSNWRVPFNRFDMRQQDAYSQKVLGQAVPFFDVVSFYELAPGRPTAQLMRKPYGLPEDLAYAIETISRQDAQYTLQVEDIDDWDPLYRLRMERNVTAARTAFAWLKAHPTDVVLTPNGSILEMGVVYRAARTLNIPVVTYEFGEQKDRIWLAQNGEVMRQETAPLWEARGHEPLSEQQQQKIRSLFESRQNADLWGGFSRRWQGEPGQGGEAVRHALELDERPIVLLAANVIGDSLTLGRQVFTDSMTEWLQDTVRFFEAHPECQLVVRIHPGERYTKGPSVAEVVQAASPKIPEHIHLVAADDPINTYDLLEIADLGLVYTTTVGLEMAMSGVPAIVVGQTHYRGKGFSLDPDSWDEYHKILTRALEDPENVRLNLTQVELAWNYAYRFFFEYPQPFPWHLLHFWKELETWPVERVLSAEGQLEFGETFAYLVGEEIDWSLR
jgi:hypothetical protein